jgi:hypothetical protein
MRRHQPIAIQLSMRSPSFGKCVDTVGARGGTD